MYIVQLNLVHHDIYLAILILYDMCGVHMAVLHGVGMHMNALIPRSCICIALVCKWCMYAHAGFDHVHVHACIIGCRELPHIGELNDRYMYIIIQRDT